MKVTCPQCGTHYNVTPKQMGPAGRTLQCAKCKHKWFVAPAVAASQDAAGADVPPLPPSALPGLDELARVGSGPRWWRRVRVGWGPEFSLTLAGLVVAGMAVGGFNWLLGYTPEEEGLGQAAGVASFTHQPGPQPKGLVLGNLARDIKQEDGNTLLVIHGTVANATGNAAQLPDLRVQLLDRDGFEIDYWPVTYASNPLEAGQNTSWQVTFVNPPLGRVAAYRAFFVTQEAASARTNTLDSAAMGE